MPFGVVWGGVLWSDELVGWSFGEKSKQGQGNLGPSCKGLWQGRAPEWGLGCDTGLVQDYLLVRGIPVFAVSV